jgi:hypothetical protein
VIAQREFGREFGIHCSRAVPSTHAIKTWVWNLEVTGSTLKKKDGSLRTVGTHKNIAVVRDANWKNPHRSACRYSVSLGLSETRVRQILHYHLSSLV